MLSAAFLAGIGKVVLRACAWVGTGEHRGRMHGYYSAKRTCTRVQWTEDIAPTVAFNLRTVRKGKVTIKIWDVAGELLSFPFDVVEGNGVPKGREREAKDSFRRPFALPYAS